MNYVLIKSDTVLHILDDGVQEGHGKETWTDGSGFEGSYKQGQKSGRGKAWWPNGLYEGDLLQDQLHGEGGPL